MQSGAHMYSKDRDVMSKREALAVAKRIADTNNCSDSDEWLECLRSAPADKLVVHQLMPSFGQIYQTVPVVGTEYLPNSASRVFKLDLLQTLGSVLII